MEQENRFTKSFLEALKSQLTERGATKAMAQGMIDMMAAKNEGLDHSVPRIPQATTPTTFRQWCEEELKPAMVS